MLRTYKIEPLCWRDTMPGLRFYGKLRTVLADWCNERLGGTKTIEKGAILQRLSRSEEEWNYIIKNCQTASFAINTNVMSEYEQVLSGNHPLVVFVVSPISKPWYARWKGQTQLAALLARLRSFPNTLVLDLCTPNIDSYGLDEFMDLTHLNEKGARRFSKELKAELDKLGWCNRINSNPTPDSPPKVLP